MPGTSTTARTRTPPNAIVSYYGKGSLVGLCLDLHIRASTGGRKSLDDVMQALWAKHGRTGVGVAEDGVEKLAEAVTRLKLKPLFDRWLRSTAELPLARLLATHGVEMTLLPARSESDKGGLAPVKSILPCRRGPFWACVARPQSASSGSPMRWTAVRRGVPDCPLVMSSWPWTESASLQAAWRRRCRAGVRQKRSACMPSGAMS